MIRGFMRAWVADRPFYLGKRIIKLTFDRTTLNEIIDLVNSLLMEQGELACLEVHEDGRLLRIFLDSARGVDLNDCAKLSQKLLDHPRLSALLPDNYEWEVSSPGVDRPLRLIEDFAACLEEKVDIKLVDSTDGRRHVIGVLKTVSAAGELEIATTRGDFMCNVQDILKANMVFDWNKKKESSDSALDESHLKRAEG